MVSKRLEHFKHWLALLQGKLGDSFVDKVVEDVIKPNVRQGPHVTQSEVKHVLKEHKLHTVYEYIPYITNKINNVQQWLSPNLETTLYDMYMQMEQLFAAHCKQQGKAFSFPSNADVFHKLLNLLGEDYTVYNITLPHTNNELVDFLCTNLHRES